MSKRRNFHKSSYKTRLSQLSREDEKAAETPTTVSKQLREQFYEASTILERIQVNLTKFGGPVQGQVRFAGTTQRSNHRNHQQQQHHHHHRHHGIMNNSSRSNIISNRKKIVSFLGIPYAQSPVGSKQFESAKLSTTWTAPLDASRQPPKCPQGAHFFSAISDMVSVDDSESEDCLYLSIWAPFEDRKDPKQQKLIAQLKPVLVYFHSGLFSFGTISSRDFDPSNLVADEGIVVVTVQYRLGALGFASFDSDSRNKSDHMSLALGDQIRSLEWIHSNIETFGGNSKQITISGHGSGAITVCAHLLNPAINQLFHRVIVQGLQNLLNIGIYGLNDRATKTLFDELSCSNDNQTPNNNSLLALKKCSIKNKVKASSIVEYQHFMFQKHPVPFGPEFEPFTKRLIEEIRGIKEDSFSGQKLNISRLIELFQNWNIFPKHIQFLIGLNSDDDYKLDSANRHNGNIRFDEEEEEETETDEGDSETDNKNNNTLQGTNTSSKLTNNTDKVDKNGDNDDDDATTSADDDNEADENEDVAEDDDEEIKMKVNKTTNSRHV